MYNVISRIGSGGFGNVDHVKDQTGNDYAMKTFSINQPVPLVPELAENVRRRFIREANVQSGLQHRNIVPVVNRNLTASPPYFIMPLAVSSLDKDIKNNKNLAGKYRTALMDILSGLEELHSLGIYHRDLKPQNVLRLSDVHGEYYAISDFGLMSVKDTQLSVLTHTGMKMGSDYYTAPEIVADLKNASIFSDIYSVGCILHDFVGTGERIPCNEIAEDTSPYADIIRACTRKKPSRRFASVAALRDAILSIDPNSVIALNTEVTSFIGALESSDPIHPQLWSAMINYIEDNEDSDDANLLLHKITLNRIQEIINLDVVLAARLGEKYATWVSNATFNFDECDGICNRLCEFLSLVDLTCQSEALLALLFMGTSHNRWYVERRFVNAVGSNMQSDLAKRLALEMGILDGRMCKAVNHLQQSIGVTHDQFHPDIVQIIQRVCR
jgi:serine/threonine protein kinase